MERNASIQHLREKTILKLLPETCFQELINKSAFINYKKSELIWKQGTNAAKVIYIFEGLSKLYLEFENNKNFILTVFPADSFIGLSTLFASQKNTYSCAALNDLKGIIMNAEVISKCAEKNIEFLFAITKLNSYNATAMMTKMLIMQNKHLRGRVADILLYFSNELFMKNIFQLPISRLEISEWACMSMENTVRCLSELNRDGIINLSNRHVEIIDKEKLIALSKKG